MNARLTVAALGALHPDENRIPAAELVARLTVEFPDVNEDRLGRALVGAGWTRKQWRLPDGTRTRGYAPPAFREVPEIALPPPQPAAPASLASAAAISASPKPPPVSTGFPAAAAGISAEAVPVIPSPAPSGFIPGRVSCGPHAGHRPPGEPCRCGGRRWWRSTGRSQGWSCAACRRPMAGQPIAVVEMPGPAPLVTMATPPRGPLPEPTLGPMVTGRATLPAGTVCVACGGKRWWVSRISGPPTWLCCTCLPFRPGAVVALPPAASLSR